MPYEPYNFGGVDLTPCIYCGLPADSIDHVPPITARPRIASLGLANRYPNREVRSCRECNSALGSRGWSVTERKALVKDHLQRKYSKYLAIPKWSDSELMALGESLRQYVRACLEKQRVVRDRLKW